LGGGLEIRRELGRGGMGVVWEAFDRALERSVAIKQLKRSGDGSGEELERFLREARLVAQLRHPNIIEIHNVVEEGGEAFLVFDLVEGRSLESLLAENGRLHPAQVSKIVGELCAALAYAHERRIIHRDLKPGNIMLAQDGTCRVMDFGIAHQARSEDLTQTAAWGTPPYMAPEQMTGRVCPESDLFALGVLAYEALTGTRPFPGPDFYGQKASGAFVPPSKAADGVPLALDAVFARALAADPANRFRGAEEFRRAFAAALA
jgi:serine/threonine protein kinase